MKKILLTIMLLLPLAVTAQGELYKRYASRPDLTVAQVSGFRLNDSVRVDVVLLAADDEAAWQKLKKEFGIDGTEGVTSWLGDVRQPSRRTRWSGAPVVRVVASHGRRTVGLYQLDSERQYDALVDYQLSAMQNPSKKK